MERRKRIREEKWKAFLTAMNERYPIAFDIYKQATVEARKCWKNVGMFLGEEEFYGNFGVRISEDLKMIHSPLEVMYSTAFVEALLDKLEKELQWFKKNKKKLEILLKEYETREKYK